MGLHALVHALPPNVPEPMDTFEAAPDLLAKLATLHCTISSTPLVPLRHHSDRSSKDTSAPHTLPVFSPAPTLFRRGDARFEQWD